MTNKTTKRALLFSVVALFLCCAMLMGTTYAWFTDEVTSANNVIKSGNLDVELEYWNGSAWVDVSGKSDILTNTLWEPGVAEVAYLRVANAGSLALKYMLGVNIVNEIAGTNAEGDPFLLSDYIQFGVVEGIGVDATTKAPTKYATREDAVAAVPAADKISTGYTKASSMDSGDELYLALVVYMPESVGNVANHDGVNVPQIDLGINIFATQVSAESDSFGTDYDASVSTVDEANALLAAGKDAFLLNCNEPDGILAVPAGYTGLLTIANSTLKSVQAEENVKIVILGNVVVNANGSGAATVAAQTAFDGSAITAKGNLDISGDGTLTAIAANVEGASGIGGMDTKRITLTGITVELAQGAYAYGVGTDTKYYKDAPEGGAAIGSGFDGAVITLKDVAVVNAIGGSKAAGIGARYHVGVTVNIEDSAIAYVEGGVSAAGIGGSRISNGAAENGVVINIKDSEVNAKGGAYGAGIGSGYDTHCQASQPLCTINIENSIINAEGGKYAAGVGTGYHHAALAGEIKNSTVTAKSGEKWYKDTYTTAMDIGFGVTDPAREGQQNGSLIYNGKTLTTADAATVVATADELKAALAAGKKNVTLANDITVNVTGTAFTVESGVSVKIDLNGHNIIATSTSTESVELFYVNGTLEIVGNGAVALTGKNFGWNSDYRYTTINIRETGKVTLGEDVTVLCKASNGADYGMNYAVDIYKEGVLNINGATLYSNYIVVRCFFDGGVVNVGAGSEIIGTHDSGYGILLQDSPNAKVTIDSSVRYTFDGSTLYYF